MDNKSVTRPTMSLPEQMLEHAAQCLFYNWPQFAEGVRRSELDNKPHIFYVSFKDLMQTNADQQHDLYIFEPHEEDVLNNVVLQALFKQMERLPGQKSQPSKYMVIHLQWEKLQEAMTLAFEQQRLLTDGSSDDKKQHSMEPADIKKRLDAIGIAKFGENFSSCKMDLNLYRHEVSDYILHHTPCHSQLFLPIARLQKKYGFDASMADERKIEMQLQKHNGGNMMNTECFACFYTGSLHHDDAADTTAPTVAGSEVSETPEVSNMDESNTKLAQFMDMVHGQLIGFLFATLPKHGELRKGGATVTIHQWFLDPAHNTATTRKMFADQFALFCQDYRVSKIDLAIPTATASEMYKKWIHENWKTLLACKLNDR